MNDLSAPTHKTFDSHPPLPCIFYPHYSAPVLSVSGCIPSLYHQSTPSPQKMAGGGGDARALRQYLSAVAAAFESSSDGSDLEALLTLGDKSECPGGSAVLSAVEAVRASLPRYSCLTSRAQNVCVCAHNSPLTSSPHLLSPPTRICS